MKTHSFHAAFAGHSYPEDPRSLLREFGQALESHRPEKSHRPRVPKMLLVPHIDLRVDFDIYARTYTRLLQLKKFPGTVYILGVGHHCPHEFSACACEYLTPLGRVSPATTPLADIEAGAGFSISRSPATFEAEHSIEYVVIWLQAIRDLYFPGQSFEIVPILMGGLFETMRTGRLPAANHEITRFGRAVADSFRNTPDSLLIASIDGCHVGPRFDHAFAALPPVQRAVQKWERELWRLCRSGLLKEFIAHLSRVENGFYFDGVGVLTLLLRNFNLKAIRSSHNLWYEERDQSFVTFSGGHFRIS